MIPIKFRGRGVETGELITGYGVYSDPPADTERTTGKKKDSWVRRTFIIRLPFPLHQPTCWIDVAPESIERLVGYDEDGQEIYQTIVLT